MKIDILKSDKEKGFTIIETVISIAIFVMVFVALISIFSSVMNVIRNNRAMLAANNIIIEKLEVVRGMDYDNVITDTGFVPPGPLKHRDVGVVRSGMTFTVLTDITFVDDPFDGLTPTDTFNKDYKKVRVTVKWKNPITHSESSSTASTNVVPTGLEGLADGFGGIYLTVFDTKGEPVEGATVNVTSTDATCPIPVGEAVCSPIAGLTDNNGNLWIPSLIPADDYHVVVSKAGYSTAQTYAVSAQNPVPEKADLRVIDQMITEAGFAIDLTGSMNIKTVHLPHSGNWYVNITQTENQTNPSMVLSTTASVTDPLMKDILVAYSSTRDLPSPYIYMTKMRYNSASQNYNRIGPDPAFPLSDKKSVMATNALSPQLALSSKDGAMYMVWSDESAGAGNSDIYIKILNPANGGRYGALSYLVSHDATNQAQVNPSVSVDKDGNIYVAWEDNRNGNWDIYAQKIAVNSTIITTPVVSFPWGATDFKVNTNADTSDQLSPKVVTDREASSNFYVMWKSNHSGNFDIYLSKFDGNKAVAIADKKINTDAGTSAQYDPDMVYDGVNNFYMVWADERNSQPDIYAQKMSKVGTLGWAGDKLINDDTSADARRVKPVIAYRSDTEIYISWEDSRNGGVLTNIYSNKIDSAAVRKWSYDFLASITMESSQTDPALIVDSGGRPVTVWQDDRDSATYGFDIYATRYTYDMGSVIAPDVPVTVTSAKNKGTTLDVPPVGIPKYEEEFTSDSVTGEIDIPALELGNYSFSINHAVFCLVSSNPSFPLMVNPGATSYMVLDTCP